MHTLTSYGTGRGGAPRAQVGASPVAGPRRWLARHAPPCAVALGCAVALACAVVPCAPALARAADTPPTPSATTGGASDVGYGSAVLSGTVNPNGSDTSYYFQYGPTRAYGGQSTIASAGSGTHPLSVSLALGGLQPLTVYHYRLVAVNAGGAAFGADASLLTKKVPLSVAIFAAPDPTVFGGSMVVQGTLSGTGNANTEVLLQANPFPFGAGFQDVGNPELTTAGGSFSFALLGLEEATQFRVATATNPPLLSAVVLAQVAVRVSAHVAGARRRHFVRIYGTVTPAENGAQVGFMRIVRGRSVLAGGTGLRPLNAGSSYFSRVVPARPGLYKVLVRVTGGAQASSYSGPLLIG